MFVFLPIGIFLVLVAMSIAFGLLRFFSTPFMPLIRPWIQFSFLCVFALAISWVIELVIGVEFYSLLILASFIIVVYFKDDEINGQNILIPLYIFLFYKSLKDFGLDLIADFPTNEKEFEQFIAFVPEFKSFEDYERLIPLTLSFVGVCSFFMCKRFPYLPKDLFALIFFGGVMSFYINGFFKPLAKNITSTFEIYAFYILSGLSVLICVAGVFYTLYCIFKDNHLKLQSYTDEYGRMQIYEDQEKSEARHGGVLAGALFLGILYIISQFIYHYAG
ncbi:hypothetical protein DMB92_02055 [Campylobacter sp. MIT 99-7217]|uniref:hypothetical protein n=1 Tax=Campylobacter sp. MIT 99-7217 TaxID=535091 RepID=UPI0011586BFB|nr:hypothetical protein [Campylobacter sp. MIT 99-7217]TQR33693.1 hypothetical protein DMB92_02055 [Campylobacter sp. MIT 99-7217]